MRIYFLRSNLIKISVCLAVSCKDVDFINCPKWAVKGECETNSWMMDNCAKSCGICGKYEPEL